MIDKDKKYTISEVSKMTGYEPHVLRYYESDFNLSVPRTESNRRYYTFQEIEKVIYIKELKEKGLTNKQIKLILETPEVLINESNQEIAISKGENNELPRSVDLAIRDKNHIISDYATIIEMNKSINDKITETKNEIIRSFEEFKEVLIDKEEDEPKSKDKDVLLCENARLKMKLKEKSYELAELKDKLRRSDCKNTPLWKRIFS